MDRKHYTGPPPPPPRRKLPDERESITHHFIIYGIDRDSQPKQYDVYLTTSCYEDGSLGEIFVRMGKPGGREGVLLDAWCRIVSRGLQCGMPVSTVIECFEHLQFEPQGPTSGHPAIHFCKSPLDYIAKYLRIKFMPAEVEEGATE